MDQAEIVAEKLLEIQAIQLSPEQPFTWASGWRSPIYCDNRRILSFPLVRDFIKTALCGLVSGKFSDAGVIAGVATAGIPHGILIADQLDLPFVYVRSGPKDHGLGNRIEGYLVKGQQVVVVEDLISTGKSSLAACEALDQAGALVLGLVAIFDYGFEQARISFEAAGITYYSLSGYQTLIRTAAGQGLIRNLELETLGQWRLDPQRWGRK